MLCYLSPWDGLIGPAFYSQIISLLNLKCNSSILQALFSQYIYIYIYTHTHTHTHIYIYIACERWGAQGTPCMLCIRTLCNLMFHLTFIGPCILIYFYSKTNQILPLLASKQWQYLIDISLLLYVQSWTPDVCWKDHPKHAELFQNKTNLRHGCIWLVLL